MNLKKADKEAARIADVKYVKNHGVENWLVKQIYGDKIADAMSQSHPGNNPWKSADDYTSLFELSDEQGIQPSKIFEAIDKGFDSQRVSDLIDKVISYKDNAVAEGTLSSTVIQNEFDAEDVLDVLDYIMTEDEKQKVVHQFLGQVK